MSEVDKDSIPACGRGHSWSHRESPRNGGSWKSGHQGRSWLTPGGKNQWRRFGCRQGVHSATHSSATSSPDRKSGSSPALLKCKYPSHETWRLWWYYWLAQRRSFLALTTTLAQSFSPKEQVYLYQAELKARQKKPEETMANLGWDIAKLVHQANPTAVTANPKTFGLTHFWKLFLDRWHLTVALNSLSKE